MEANGGLPLHFRHAGSRGYSLIPGKSSRSRLSQKTGGNPVGEPLAALFEPAGCEEIQRACRRCLDNGGVSRCSMPVQDEQGDRLYLDVSLTAFHHDNETMIIFWGKDITPSMRLRQQREALLREYDRLFSCSVAGIGLVRLSPNAAPVLERSNETFNRFVSLIQTSPQYGDWNALFLDNIRQGIDSTRQVFLTSTLKTGTLMWISFSFGKTACRSRHSYWS